MESMITSVTLGILLFIASLIIVYVMYYFIAVVKQPLIACREGPWKEFLKENIPLLQEAYWPTPWCLDGRFQTVFGAVTRYTLPPIQYQREVLTLKDGGILALDWYRKPKTSDDAVTVILPGLTGSSQSEYIKGFVNNLKNIENVAIVIFNHRGMGGVELKTTRAYCGANSDDFEEAIEHIHLFYPSSPILASGVSLGGMVIGNYLVTRGEKAAKHLAAALVFSVPWDLSVTEESIEKPLLNLLLNYTLTRTLKKLFANFRNRLEGHNYPWNFIHLMQSKTIREFDDRFTALNFGYRDVKEYYADASLHNKLQKIRVPLLCLTAADDPFLPMRGIPVSEANCSSHVAIIVTSHGGHIGFLEGINPKHTCYSDRFYAQFVTGVFSHLQDVNEIQKEGDQYIKALTKGNVYEMK